MYHNTTMTYNTTKFNVFFPPKADTAVTTTSRADVDFGEIKEFHVVAF
jgi:hypothetical protein